MFASFFAQELMFHLRNVGIETLAMINFVTLELIKQSLRKMWLDNHEDFPRLSLPLGAHQV